MKPRTLRHAMCSIANRESTPSYVFESSIGIGSPRSATMST
jgi:hypothetical protein